MACHILGAPNLALRLGAPTSVECIKKVGVSNFMFPVSSVIRFDFPARGSMPPVKLFWYDGMKEQPRIPGVPEGEYLGDLFRPLTGGGCCLFYNSDSFQFACLPLNGKDRSKPTSLAGKIPSAPALRSREEEATPA